MTGQEEATSICPSRQLLDQDTWIQDINLPFQISNPNSDYPSMVFVLVSADP